MMKAFRLAGWPMGRWDEWSRSYLWGEKARVILRQWCLYAPEEALVQLDRLVDTTPSPILDFASKRGNGILLATAHGGPDPIGVRYFERLREDTRTMALGDNIEDRWAVTNGGAGKVIRAASRWLRQGGLAMMTLDRPHGGDKRRIDLPPYSVEVSALAPRLAYATGVPTVWGNVDWAAGRAVLSLRPLPDPLPDESSADFVTRWCKVFAGYRFQQFKGMPENIVGHELASSEYDTGEQYIRALLELSA